MRKSFYQILDVGIALQSDSEELLELFAVDYGWFETKTLTLRKSLDISAILQDQRQSPFLKINDDIFSLRDHPSPCKHSYRAVLKKILAEVEEFLVFHAAVAVKNGQALILAGLPGSGKTSLLLELLKRGFAYYSDDFCPIHRESGLVHPFPRALWQSQALSECNPGSGSGRLRKHKTPLRVDSLDAPSGDVPCQANMLICLGAGRDTQAYCDLEIGLKAGIGDAVIEDMRALPGVVATPTDDRHLEWQVSIPGKGGLTVKVREILEKHASSIWNVYRVDDVESDFDREPILSRMSVREAALRLIADLKHNPLPREGSNAFRDLPGAFFASITQILTNTACYQLSPGCLGAMGECVIQAWEGGARV